MSYRFWRFDQLTMVGGVIEVGEWGLSNGSSFVSGTTWTNTDFMYNTPNGTGVFTAMTDGVLNVRSFQLVSPPSTGSLVYDAGSPISPTGWAYTSWFRPDSRYITGVRVSVSNDGTNYTPYAIFSGLNVDSSAALKYYAFAPYLVTPPDPPSVDPNFANVSLLLHMNGNEGSTTFIDSSVNNLTVSPIGGTAISTVQSKFGGASGFFNGSNSGLTISENNAFKLGTGDFTVELQAYRTGTGTGDRFLLDHANGTGWLLRWAGTTLQFYLTSQLMLSYTFDFILNQWYHIAVSRSGNNLKMFVNGFEVAGVVETSPRNGSANNGFGIGSIFSGTGDRFQGYIDEVRITKGVGRYTAPFYPPTGAFPDTGTLPPSNIFPTIGQIWPLAFPASPPPVFPTTGQIWPLVFSMESSPPAPVSIPISSIVYSQSSVYPGTTPISNAMMTDGSFNNTGAATNNGGSQWIQMDLGAEYEVANVVIGTATSNIPGGWSSSYTSNRSVEYSSDGSSWTQSFMTPNYAGVGIYTHPVSFTARYIRLNGGNGWTAMSEFYAVAPGQIYP